MTSISLYFHIPFCATRCSYCSFYSTTDLAQIKPYTNAVITAVKTADLRGCVVDTIYFGGGTPSLLGEGLCQILKAVRDHHMVSDTAEITLEANPNAVSLAILKDFYKSGFNRISYGVQSSSGEVLASLGRTHNFAQAQSAIQMSRTAGFTNLSADFIFATPNQTLDQAVLLVDDILSLDVPHISAYLLKVENGTRLAKLCAPTDFDDDITADIYSAISQKMTGAGYEHYEISNFARAGYRSRHNSAYWQLTPYLGIGAAAHSGFRGKRFYFPDDVSAFITAADKWALVQQDGNAGGYEEYIMLGLRLVDGISFAVLAEQYDKDSTFIADLKKRASRLVTSGHANIDSDKLSLTPSGFLLSNSIIAYLLG